MNNITMFKVTINGIHLSILESWKQTSVFKIYFSHEDGSNTVGLHLTLCFKGTVHFFVNGTSFFTKINIYISDTIFRFFVLKKCVLCTFRYFVLIKSGVLRPFRYFVQKNEVLCPKKVVYFVPLGTLSLKSVRPRWGKIAQSSRISPGDTKPFQT